MIESNDDGTVLTCSDGTTFFLQTERPLHEPTWHSVLRRDPGADGSVPDTSIAGGLRKQPVIKRMKRAAEAHEATL